MTTTRKQGREVSITRAADSDRGEIDVLAFSWDADDDFYEEGGRYERSEYHAARAEADELSVRHGGLPVTDEVG